MFDVKANKNDVNDFKYYSNKDYFPCYSPKLHMFLQELGLKNDDEVVNIFTHKIKWVYKRTDELSIALKMWTNEK